MYKIHWPSQEQLEVAYERTNFQGISPRKYGETYGTTVNLHWKDPEMSIDHLNKLNCEYFPENMAKDMVL